MSRLSPFFPFHDRTWGYVERELPSVPNHVPVLVLASFRDMADHRTVAEDTMRYFIENFER